MELLLYVIVFALTVFAEFTSAENVTQQRCCPGNQVLDIELRKCVYNLAVYKTYQENSEVNDPLFRCSNGWETFKTDDLSAGVITEPLFNQTVQLAQYCVHSIVLHDGRTEAVVAYCRTPLMEVKKCCPIGQSVNRNSVEKCVPNDGAVFNASKIVIPVGLPFRIVDNSSLNCEHDYNIYVPKLFVDNRYQINASGHFAVKRALYKVLRYSSNYCVDIAVDAQGNQEVVDLGVK